MNTADEWEQLWSGMKKWGALRQEGYRRAKGSESKLGRGVETAVGRQNWSKTAGETSESNRGVAHLAGNTFTSVIRAHILLTHTNSFARLGVCLLPSAPVLSLHISSIQWNYTFFNTHILYAHSHRHTHIHTLPVSHCLCVSLRRMSITAQGKEVPIRRQECDASGGPMTTDNTLARVAVWVRVRVRPTVVRV